MMKTFIFLFRLIYSQMQLPMQISLQVQMYLVINNNAFKKNFAISQQ